MNETATAAAWLALEEARKTYEKARASYAAVKEVTFPERYANPNPFPGFSIRDIPVSVLDPHATAADVSQVMDDLFERCQKLRQQGHAEYAGGENAFGNFVRLGKDLQLPPEKVLWTHAAKHLDGILSFINGHTSQRDSLEGRIADFIVYMVLLAAMTRARGKMPASSLPIPGTLPCTPRPQDPTE